MPIYNTRTIFLCFSFASMAHSTASEYSIENVYQSFSKVIDSTDNESIGLPEFVIAFRELSK